MNLKEAHDLILPFFTKKEGEILEQFANLSNQGFWLKPKKSDYGSVFVRGTRKDKVLLVAHVDTVWNDSPNVKVDFEGIFYSASRDRGVNKKSGRPYLDGMGIGADDRAGCAMLWAFRNSGHSLLLVNGEESGCLGSQFLMAIPEIAEQIHDHQFVVQFDRRGRNDLVFYNVSTPEFQEYCQAETTYKPNYNFSSTDICVLCEQICGVNMSVGYVNEHTPNEILSLRNWLRTAKTSWSWLNQKELPKYLMA